MKERSFDLFKQQAKEVVGEEPWEWIFDRLSRVYRWGYIPGVRKDFESDAMHVEDLFDNNDNLLSDVPRVIPYVNLTIVRTMFVLHDSPEIFVGDLSHQHPNYEQLRTIHKRREELAMKSMVRVFESANPDKMKRLYELGIDPINLLIRFERHEDDDPETLLAKYHDYEQAIIKAKNIIY